MRRIARFQQQRCRQQIQRLGQVVAELFQLAAQERIVQHETRVILQHAQRLAGTVGAGVENAGGVHLFRRFAQDQRLVQDDRRRFADDAEPQVGEIEPERLQLAAQAFVLAQKGE